MIKNKLISKNHKGIISDFSEANFQIGRKETVDLKELHKENLNILKNLKFAQIITTPQIAIPMIFKKENAYVNTRSFSSMAAAKEWMNQV